MPKQKTHKGTAKRIKLTAGKKLLRGRTNAVHFRQKQSGSRQRRIATSATVIGSIAKNIKRALGV